MSKAYKCDRCGKLFEIETEQQHIIDNINLRMVDCNDFKSIDICIECQDGFINWWHKLRKETEYEK